jgi:hypothetical protein
VRSLLRLFRKPLVQATLHAGSTAERAPTCGLVVIETTVEASAAATATVRLFVGDAHTPAFEKLLAVGPQPRSFWLALHGQLLPNGPAPLRLELVDSHGARICERALTVHVRNEGPVAEQVRASLTANRVPLVLDG